jgi:hypothetical protein
LAQIEVQQHAAGDANGRSDAEQKLRGGLTAIEGFEPAPVGDLFALVFDVTFEPTP